ncbi:hypothetical protein DFQ30_008930 [Apophysomyces sp. BC1015]|nr:hypothetical protein DFQ30_008930 [Apophysomyces sp. BC1015]
MQKLKIWYLPISHPDPIMKEAIEDIYAVWNDVDATDGVKLHRPTIEGSEQKRRRKNTTNIDIPDAATINADLHTTTVLEIADASELAENIDQLKLPDQMASVLENRILQHALVCDPSPSAIARISLWLAQSLLDIVKWSNKNKKSDLLFKDLLQKMVTMTRFTKSHLPVVENFLRDYLKTWNGIEFGKEVFELLTFVKPESFDELYISFLKPLYRLYCVSDVVWKSRLILCYTEWLKNWALLDWNRHSTRRATADPNEEVDNLIWLFQGLSYNVDYFRTMQEFIQHVDQVNVMGLILEEDHPLLQHATLSFFELVSSISIHHDIPEIIIPAAPFVYRTFFSVTPMAVSRVCGIIAQYKKAFEDNDRKTSDWVSRHTQSYLDHFNAYVMDICNALWRNLALSRTGQTAMAFSLTDEIIEKYKDICETRDEQLSLSLSLTHSAAFIGFSKRFTVAKEDGIGVSLRHDGPLTSQYLKELSQNNGLPWSYSEFRFEYLDYISKLGLRGVHDLLYSCMNSLINRRQAIEQAGYLVE